MNLIGLLLLGTPIMAAIAAAWYLLLRKIMGRRPPAISFVGLAWATCVVTREVADGWSGAETMLAFATLYLAPAALILGFVLLRRHEMGVLS